MQFTNSLSRRLIALTVLFALLFAPLWPAVASMTHGSAHAMHAMAADAAHGMQHEGHDMSGKSSCGQHDSCGQLCCAACAQCTTVMQMNFSHSILVQFVQSPTVPRLHDRLAVAPHLRPPAA